MSLRPIVLDNDGLVIGGNMRLKACIDLGWKEVPTDIFTTELWEENESKLPIEERKSYEYRCDEFIIKDNSSSGEWEYDILANKWDNKAIIEWGVDVWEAEEIDYSANLNPSTDYSDVTKEDIEKQAKKLAEEMIREMKHAEVMCPKCNHEFEVQL